MHRPLRSLLLVAALTTLVACPPDTAPVADMTAPGPTDAAPDLPPAPEDAGPDAAPDADMAPVASAHVPLDLEPYTQGGDAMGSVRV